MAISLKVLLISLFSVSIAGNCFFLGYYTAHQSKEETVASVNEIKTLEENSLIQEIGKEYLINVVPQQQKIKALQDESIVLLTQDKFIPDMFQKKVEELFKKEIDTKRITSNIIIKFATNSKIGDRKIISSYLKSGQLKNSGNAYLNSIMIKRKTIKRKIYYRNDNLEKGSNKLIPKHINEMNED